MILPAADDFLDPTRPSGWAHEAAPKKGAADPAKYPIVDKREPMPPVVEDSKATCG